MYEALYIGTIVFVVLGLLGCVGFGWYVTQGVPPQQKFENRSIAFTTVTVAAFCMWLMWISVYMHQLNPLISPVLEKEE